MICSLALGKLDRLRRVELRVRAKAVGNLMVGYSRFRSHIRQEAKGYEIEGNRAERQSIKRDSRYKSEMEDLSVRLSVDYSPQ